MSLNNTFITLREKIIFKKVNKQEQNVRMKMTDETLNLKCGGNKREKRKNLNNE